MWSIKTYSLFGAILFLITGCSKSDSPGSTNTGGGSTGNPNNANCLITTISQVNNRNSTESSLSVVYDNNLDIVKLTVYDSVHKIKNFGVDFIYITADSIRLDGERYMIRDANKRITRFVTKSDVANSSQADRYVFEYKYNSDGYLSKKELFINGASKANFETVYSYTNNNLTGCVMTTPSAGNRKVLESTLSYSLSSTPKNWIYNFPDAMEGYPFLSVLNFGKRSGSLLTRVVTKIYDPAQNTLIDTWSTDYVNYLVDSNGYVQSAEATGDLQQGIASVYGKTKFYYTCH